MAKRYAIWNKADPVVTPVGEVFTADQWKQRYPVAAIDGITIVCSPAPVNGGFFGILQNMVQMYEASGADFSGAATDEDKLDVIEAFEDAQSAVSDVPSVEERTAAALEFIALNSLPDAQ